MYKAVKIMEFEWDEDKENANIEKHGVSFHLAKLAFDDTKRVFEFDSTHSIDEEIFHCYGYVGVMIVRFTMRGGKIRIFGAAYWRKGRKAYEEKEKHKG